MRQMLVKTWPDQNLQMADVPGVLGALTVAASFRILFQREPFQDDSSRHISKSKVRGVAYIFPV